MTFIRTENREPRHSPGQIAPILLALALSATMFWSQPQRAMAQEPSAAALIQDSPRRQAGRIVTLDGSRIQGEQELPTVLYLVPWQPVETTGPEPLEEQLLTEGAVESLEREAFRRRLEYSQRPDNP